MIIRNLHSRNLSPFYTDFVRPANLIVIILHHVLLLQEIFYNLIQRKR